MFDWKIIIFPFFSYIAWTGDFELAGKDETETPEQKYQRLNCEVRQLLDDLDQLKESGAEKVGNQSLIGLAKQTASLQDQLAGLKLEEYLGSEPVKDLKVSKFRNVLSYKIHNSVVYISFSSYEQPIRIPNFLFIYFLSTFKYQVKVLI